MRKTTSLIILLLFSITVFSQSRTNRQKLTFTNSSEKLTSSTGWCYNTTLGEWIGYDNVIEDDKEYQTKYKSLQGGYLMSRTDNNFLSIQTKTTSYKGIKYYVLMIKQYDGVYKYPSIYEDWYFWKETNGYLFTEDEYNKLNNLNGETKLETKYHVHLGSSYEKYDETKFLDLIQTELGREKSEYSSTYTFPILKSTSDETEVIRFFVPQSFSSYRTYNFEKEYFEVSPQEFDKIIIK